ncbi:hypothetical protein AZ78_3387 [Lysobacter capsici AZ78]|uniref:Uncharacterized protein n=1 Tax=Lysobacter capsici AZ78 TaxID=1444315 RepID=A0A108UB35_9GAMM|nr:hypothetical protein AZ78_3387 [Lysobacter capsici AZ78]
MIRAARPSVMRIAMHAAAHFIAGRAAPHFSAALRAPA